MRYLDDYFTVGPAYSSICAHNVKTILHVASQVSIPLAPNKLEGPTTCLVFLGILIDTNYMETSLPDDKLHELISLWTPILVYSQQMSQKRTSVLDWQTELRVSDQPRRPHFSAPPYRRLHFSTPSTSPCHHESWSLSQCSLVPQVSSFLEWPGHYTWSLLDQIARFGTLHGCLWQSWLWHFLHGPLACRSLAPWT